MTMIAALVVWFTVKATFAAECPNPVTCPCGNSKGENVTICVPAAVHAEVCTRFSKCEACRDGFHFCTRCPEGLDGPTCTREMRQKRRWNVRLRRSSAQTSSSCSNPSSPTFGTMKCVPGGKPTSCTAKCYPGHYFVGFGSNDEMTLKCSGGVWTPRSSFPECKSAGYCDVFNQKAGKANCTINTSGLQCDVRCGTRHMGRFSCYPGRAWEPALPLCVTIKAGFNHGSNCDHPGPIVNGKVKYFAPGRTGPRDSLDYEIEKFPEGSVVEYSCNGAFLMEGPRRLTCKATGFWSVEKPTCVTAASKCSNPAKPTFGTMKCVPGGKQTSCTAKCYPGHYFVGFGSDDEMTLTCSGGVWTPRSSFPECKSAGYCDVFNQKAGSANCTINTSGLQCDVRCGTRHMGRFSCYPERAWEPALPLCVTMKEGYNRGSNCDHPGLVVNGKVKYFAPGKTSPRDRLDYEIEKFPEGSVVEYSCDEDFLIQGSRRLVCKTAGFWSVAKPSCVLAASKCSNPDRPNFGSVKCVPEGKQKLCTGKCYPGYFFVDSDSKSEMTLACSGDGWTPRSSFPDCKSSGHCDVFNQKAGSANCSVDTKGTRCDVRCGSRHMGQFFCYPGRAWQPALPLCMTMKGGFNHGWNCDHPGRIPFGKVQYFAPGKSKSGDSLDYEVEKFPEGSVVEYSCNEGFRIQGPRRLTCEMTGFWSIARPVCTSAASSCTNPTSPIFGTMKCVSGGRETFCTVKCYPGYYFADTESKDEMTLMCSKGVWTPRTSFPNCQSAGHCDLLNQKAGSANCTVDRSGTRCDVRCGSRHMGRFSCFPGHSWKPALPLCITPKAGFNHGLSCDHPGSIPNGKLQYFAPSVRGSGSLGEKVDYEIEKFPEGSVVEYSCDEGFLVQGSRRLTCKTTGFWSVSKPICVPVISEPIVYYCENPGTISNGQVMYYPTNGNKRVLTQLDEAQFPEGSRLKYSCHAGYMLFGRTTLICEKPGFWSDDQPFCRGDASRRRYCMYPGNVMNGRVEHIPVLNQRPSNTDSEEYPEGSRLLYSCEEGYTPDGPTTLTCKRTGSWSPAVPPTCINADDNDRVTCDNPGRVLNGKVLYFAPGVRNGPGVKLDSEMDEYPEGSALEYYCNKGFWLQGSHSLMCDSSGFWSAERPTCVGDCGRSFVHSSVRIRDGQETMIGEWPWVVSISLQDENGSTFVCGGAVINTRTVVTAAHCLEEGQTYILRFGKHHFKIEEDDSKVLNRTSSRVIIHPDYSRRTHDSDIGLILLQSPIEYSLRVQPICMPTIETTVRNIMNGRVGYVSGWGDTEMELPSDSLLFAGLPVLDMRTCVQSYMKQNLTVFVTGNMFCAGFHNGTYSVCSGDSGSPFVFYDNLSHRYTLEGLVSFVVRRRQDAQKCGLPGRFAIFTRVVRFVPWIYENIQ